MFYIFVWEIVRLEFQNFPQPGLKIHTMGILNVKLNLCSSRSFSLNTSAKILHLYFRAEYFFLTFLLSFIFIFFLQFLFTFLLFLLPFLLGMDPFWIYKNAIIRWFRLYKSQYWNKLDKNWTFFVENVRFENLVVFFYWSIIETVLFYSNSLYVFQYFLTSHVQLFPYIN